MGFGLPPETAMRACVIGTALARELGLPEQDVSDTFYATLLMHVGCTALAHETAAVFGDDLTVNSAVARTNFADPRDVFKTMIPEATHGMATLARGRAGAFIVTRGKAFGRRFDTGACEVARETARRIGLSEGVQQGLYEVQEWWNGAGAPRGLRADEIALPARIARAATDAALFNDFGGPDLAVDALARRSGGMLDPSIVNVFLASASQLLAAATAHDPRERILDIEPHPVIERGSAELPDVARAFGDIVDLKTPYTHGHSSEVARLACAAAGRLSLDQTTRAQLEVAALLHDLGRVGISNAVWEKRGPLTAAEWEQVRMHPYHSERVLATSRALEPIARLAGMHHERLDGSGYHRGCRGRDIPVACRVLAASDAFQAMTQPRPHRAPLPAEKAGQELARAGRAGHLDSDAVAAVLEAAGQRRSLRRRDLRPAGLSEREMEVLRLVAEGRSNRDIAKRLYISPRTADHHVQHIYAKIGVSSRAAAALNEFVRSHHGTGTAVLLMGYVLAARGFAKRLSSRIRLATVLAAMAALMAIAAPIDVSRASSTIGTFDPRSGAVFLLTNDPAGNEILVLARSDDGTLTQVGAPVPTRGLGGSDPPPDPLRSQGALVISDAGAGAGKPVLLAVNAGSNEISSLAVEAGGLRFIGKTQAGGIRPTSIAVHEDRVYVMNAGSGTISGFRMNTSGGLVPLPDSNRLLTGAAAADPAQIGFSPDGSCLVVTSKATNLIDTYAVQGDGYARHRGLFPSSGRMPYGFGFDKRGHVVVSEIFEGFGTMTSSASSYGLSPDCALEPIDGPVGNDEGTACWVVVPNSGLFAYVSNTGTGSISAYGIDRDGGLGLRDPSAATTGPASGDSPDFFSMPIDMALSRGSDYLYVHRAGSNSIGGYGVEGDGRLTHVSDTNLPVPPALAEGIAAI